MKILFFGDIVGKVGRNAILNNIDQLKLQYECDFVIANAENSAHGKGITSKIYYRLKESGVDCLTLGNHAFSKSEIKMTINDLDSLVRPVNLDPTHYGKSYRIFNVKGIRLCVTNILGEVFMDRVVSSPYSAMEKVLDETKGMVDIYLVDLHAEATGEKMIFMNHFKDEVIAVLGTHTHVQTADEKVVDGCAYITDVGMCGAYDSILGRDTEEVLQRTILNEKTRYTISDNPAMISAVVIEIDDSTLRALNITRINLHPSKLL